MPALNGQRSYSRDWIIGYTDWKLIFPRSLDADETMGECCASSKELRIAQGMGRYQIFSTFWHEVLHAIEDEYGIEIPHEMITDKLDCALAHFTLMNWHSLKKIVEGS